MTYALRKALAAIVGILVFGWTVSGCSGSARESGAVGTSGESGSAITIETSSRFVTVENHAGAPLLDLRVTLNPVGSATTFTSSISRLEAGEKRNVSFGEFRGRDGTPFSTVFLFVRPKNVVVSAVDQIGKRYEVTVPWQQ